MGTLSEECESAGKNPIRRLSYDTQTEATDALIDGKADVYITADGGHIASGRIRREDVLAQFALDAKPPSPAERIELL